MISFLLFLSLICFGTVHSTDWNVLVGAGGEDNAWQLLNYYPSVLVIKQGDTVTWTSNTPDKHTVSFSKNVTLLNGVHFDNSTGNFDFFPANVSLRNPVGPNTFNSTNIDYSSGTLSQSGNLTSYSLTFNLTGAFEYFCVYHYPYMVGNILVVSNDSVVSLPTTDNITSAEMEVIDKQLALLPELDILKARFATVPTSRNGTNGTTIWTVRIVADPVVINANLLRFLPSNFVIKMGDTVEFVNDGEAMHTVTFNSTGNNSTSASNSSTGAGSGTSSNSTSNSTFAPAIIQQNGLITFNPLLNRESDNQVYSGGVASSGILFPLGNSLLLDGNATLNESNFPNAWNITFETDGTFPYYCAFHASLGMLGEITVEPKST